MALCKTSLFLKWARNPLFDMDKKSIFYYVKSHASKIHDRVNNRTYFCIYWKKARLKVIGLVPSRESWGDKTFLFNNFVGIRNWKLRKCLKWKLVHLHVLSDVQKILISGVFYRYPIFNKQSFHEKFRENSNLIIINGIT